MKIIVTGSTGTVGAELIREAIKDSGITKIYALSRKPLLMSDPKLEVVMHQDYFNYSKLAGLLADADVLIWCLGISQTQVTKEQYYIITHDYTLAAAAEYLKNNSSARFIFVSGDGADSSEQSKTLFARVKGKTENDLRKLSFKSLNIARPGGIRPINMNPNAPFLYKLFRPVFPLMQLFAPGSIITSVQLAHALLAIAKSADDRLILENKDLQALAKTK